MLIAHKINKAATPSRSITILKDNAENYKNISFHLNDLDTFSYNT